MNVKAVSLFVSLCMLPCLAMSDSEYDATVEILWGVYPIQDAARATKGTRLVLEGEEPSVDSFLERYAARLLYVGDGACTMDAGYETAVWWGDEADVWDAVEHYGTSVPTVKGRLVLEGALQKPITTFGDPATDPKGFEAAGFDPDAYFQMKWSDKHLVVVLVDRKTGLAYHLSDTEGGEAGVAIRQLEGDYFGYLNDAWFWPRANSQHIYAESESGIVYLGAPLPARCVWMADKGLTAEDLESVDEKTVALAVALGKAPEEVRDVTLRIDGFDPETGEVSYVFRNGGEDVTKLWYGAELRLLSGAELGRWTETNMVDVATAGGRAAAPGAAGAQGFYQLELALP